MCYRVFICWDYVQLYEVSSDKVAVFSYAGLFSMSDDYYSGNLLPADQRVPDGTTYEQRLSVFCLSRFFPGCYSPKVIDSERSATFRCNYAFAFDTYHDKSFYYLQQVSMDINVVQEHN